MENNPESRVEYVRRVQGLPWYDRFLVEFLAFIRASKGAGKGSRILCVQCGSGTLAVKLAKLGAKVTAVDSSEGLVDATAAAAKRAHIRDLQALRADPFDLQFETDSFDLVVAVTLLGGLDEPEAAVGEMARVTAADGAVTTLEPSFGVRPEQVLAFTARHALTGFSFKAFQAWSEEAQAGNRFSASELERLYRKAGLSVSRQEEQMDHFLLATYGVKGSP